MERTDFVGADYRGGNHMQQQQHHHHHHQRATSSQQSYDFHSQQSTSASVRPISCNNNTSTNNNNPLRNSKRRCKITASVQSYLSHHQYHHYYHPKSHHAYLQAQKRKSLSRNSSFRMSASSYTRSQNKQQQQTRQQQYCVDNNNTNTAANNGNQIVTTNNHDNNNNDDDDEDDDDFGWGSDFDDSSSNSSTISTSSTINHRQADHNNKTIGDQSDNQAVKSSSGFMKVGKPIKNQRIIEDVIQDRGTIGNFKHISSDCLMSPPPSSSATNQQQHQQQPLVIVTDTNNSKQQTSGGLRSMLSTQLKHELNRRKMTKQQPPTSNCFNNNNNLTNGSRQHELLTDIANDDGKQSTSSDHEWEEETELDHEEEEDDDDDDEDIRSLKARQGFKQIKEKLEAIMDQRLAIYRRSISTPTIQHVDTLPVNDHHFNNMINTNYNSAITTTQNKRQDANLASSHHNLMGDSDRHLMTDNPVSNTNLNTSSKYNNYPLSSNSYNVHHQKQPAQQQQQKMMTSSKFSGNSMSNIPTLVSVSKLQSSATTKPHQQTLLTAANVGAQSTRPIASNATNPDDHSDVDDSSEIYRNGHQIIANVNEHGHNNDDDKHHNVQKDFDQQSHCSSTGSQSSGSQDSGHSTQHSSSNGSELGLKSQRSQIVSSSPVSTVASHNVLAPNVHQQQRSATSTRNPSVEPPSSPSSTVSSNDSGNSSACYVTTSGSSSSSSDIHLANSSVRSSKNLDDLYDVVDEALNYNHSASSSPTTPITTTITDSTHNITANNLSHYVHDECCLPSIPEPSSLSPSLAKASTNCSNNDQQQLSNHQRPLFNSLMFSKQIQNGIKNLRNNVSAQATAKNANTDISDILNKSLHIQVRNNKKNSGNSNFDTDDYGTAGVASRISASNMSNNKFVNNKNNNKPFTTDQPTITVLKREFNVNHQQAMVEELMSKLNKRNHRMMQQQQQQQQQLLLDNNQVEIDGRSEPEQLSSHNSQATQSAKSNEVPIQQQQNDDSSGEEKRLSLLLEQQRQMSLKLKQKPRSKRKTSNAVNLDSYDHTPTTAKSTSNLISSCDIISIERQQQQQVTSSKSAISLRQLIKNVVDDTEQPNKLSTLTMHVLNRTDSFNSDLAISDGASLSRSISSSSLSSLSSLDNSHRCTITSNKEQESSLVVADNNNHRSNEANSLTNADHDCIDRDYTDERQFNTNQERRRFDTSNNSDSIKMNKDKSTIGHYLKSLKEFNIPTKFKMPKVKLLTQTTTTTNNQQQQDNQYYTDHNVSLDVDANISNDNNDKRDHGKGIFNGSSEGLANHFVTISNRRWKSCNLKGNLTNNGTRTAQTKDSQEEQSNYQDCSDSHLNNQVNCTTSNNNNNLDDVDKNYHQYYAMNSPVRPTLNRLTYFLPEPKNGISPTTLGTYQPEHYNAM